MNIFEYFGHTLRKDDDDLVKRVLDWNPKASRRAGRIAEIWSTTVTKEAQSA